MRQENSVDRLLLSWVVAWEALEDAMKSGKNKIFISASKNQVGQIRTYVKEFSVKYYCVDHLNILYIQ